MLHIKKLVLIFDWQIQIISCVKDRLMINVFKYTHWIIISTFSIFFLFFLSAISEQAIFILYILLTSYINMLINMFNV